MTDPVHVFAADIPYSGRAATDPVDAIHQLLAFDARDWAATRADAWLWGIVCGWDEALPEVAARYGWTPAQVEQLQELHTHWQVLERDREQR